MKKSLFGLLVAVALALGAAPALHAQSTDSAIVKVPFSFIAGGKVLPAGTYRITSASTDGGGSLMITSADDKAYGAFVNTERAPNPAANSNDTHLTFRTYLGQRFLWQVVQPGNDVREVALRSPQMDRVLARLNLLPPERADVPAK
jgi:hypothetical protein